MKYQEIKRIKRVSTVVVFTAKYLMDGIDSSLAGVLGSMLYGHP